MGSWLGPLQNTDRVLLDFAYPAHCVVCLAEIEAVAILCDTCWSAIEKVKSEHEDPASDDLLFKSHMFEENII